ncbi:MAG TPA: twin-arginine translocase TatA/TatE family subunit [Candidatus Acidoferrales bacterium]|jgi:sec-independent protein translocase protein TatA|nr:twin-arginine translocase TatA/TatE family subunit [Candidatus Acidoferrales bacterium]
MNITLAWAPGGMQVILILAIVLIMFGAKKIPELAKGLGKGINEFKKATREVTDEIHNSDTTSTTPAAPKTPPANTTAQTATPASSEEKKVG